MASVRSLVTAANATVGPMAAQRRPEETKMAVVPSAEETITISQMDQILFDWFGKDSWIIPGGMRPLGLFRYLGGQARAHPSREPGAPRRLEAADQLLDVICRRAEMRAHNKGTQTHTHIHTLAHTKEYVPHGWGVGGPGGMGGLGVAR
mmetsp:Transcript_57038/g.150256  ORF Transcript_57038/g.150256 Transcript_57038/m.150256 type:complete len:149 (+) Transcript_57038:109-555(+)